MPRIPRNAVLAVLAAVVWLSPVGFASAHHVLGRPAYSLNEDSNTPPSMQAETQIGAFFVTYMVYPAFPRPGAPGRINLYVTHIDDGSPFADDVTFTVRDGSWLWWLGAGGGEETLGVRPPDDDVYRQGFLFAEPGDYVVTAAFEADGEPYTINFPLRIGEPAPVGPLEIAVSLLLAVLVAVTVIQRRRAMTGRIRGARATRDGA